MFHILKLTLYLITIALVSVAKAYSGAWDNVSFYTEEYPPYNYSEDGHIKGIAVDLLHEAALKMGSPVNADSIHLMPWARSYRTVLTRPNTVLFSAARIPLREKLFQWAGPIASTRIIILSRSKAHIRIEDTEQLKKYRIGVIIDDVGEQLIQERGVPEQNIETAYSAIALARMLEHGRIDLMAYEELAALSAIHKAGYRPENYHVSFVLNEADLYFALNHSIPQSIVNEFQTAIDALKAKNEATPSISTYDAILKKYQGMKFK